MTSSPTSTTIRSTDSRAKATTSRSGKESRMTRSASRFSFRRILLCRFSLDRERDFEYFFRMAAPFWIAGC